MILIINTVRWFKSPVSCLTRMVMALESMHCQPEWTEDVVRREHTGSSFVDRKVEPIWNVLVPKLPLVRNTATSGIGWAWLFPDMSADHPLEKITLITPEIPVLSISLWTDLNSGGEDPNFRFPWRSSCSVNTSQLRSHPIIWERRGEVAPHYSTDNVELRLIIKDIVDRLAKDCTFQLVLLYNNVSLPHPSSRMMAPPAGNLAFRSKLLLRAALLQTPRRTVTRNTSKERVRGKGKLEHDHVIYRPFKWIVMGPCLHFVKSN